MKQQSSPEAETGTTRRSFVAAVGATGAAAVLGSASDAAAANANDMIPRRPLGKTGVQVSIIGLGGSHIGKVENEKEAARIIHEGIEHGLTFMDNAWEYNQGRSEAWMGKALVGKRDAVFLMTKVCTHGRKGDVAMRQLEESLQRLGTDHIDLWQVHECIYDNDPKLHFQPDGVIEALDRAKKQGKVRFVGFTGHKDPAIHLAMLAKRYRFDTCQLPLNCFDATFRSFEQRVLPVVNKQRAGAIGMKSLGGEGEPLKNKVVTVEEAIRYVLSLPIATLVTGIDSVQVLRQNIAIAKGFKPMTAAEQKALRERVAPVASDGRYELYKTSKKYDGPTGREQHGFPPEDKVPT